MKEYVYRDLECLVNSIDGKPIRIYVPKDEIERYDEISRRAYESGYRFKMALQESGVV
jgi:hypothetical protein